jgi:hypothetical protein
MREHSFTELRMENEMEKHIAKGLSFGKKDYASKKHERLKLSATIPKDSFTLHKCRYIVIGSRCGKVLPDVKSMRTLLEKIKNKADLASIHCWRYGKTKQYVITFCGFVLTPYHIRSLLNKRIIISKLFMSRLEVKCFPHSDFNSPAGLSEIQSLPKETIPSNRTSMNRKSKRNDLDTIAYCRYTDSMHSRDYLFSIYDIAPKNIVKSWGINYEIIFRGRTDADVFESTVSDMCSILLRFAGSYIKPVSTIKSKLGYYPCGLLVETMSRRNKDAVQAIKSEVLSMVQSNGHIIHSDFVSKFSHLPTMKSKQDAVSKYARWLNLVPFYLSESKSYQAKAWRLK